MSNTSSLHQNELTSFQKEMINRLNKCNAEISDIRSQVLSDRSQSQSESNGAFSSPDASNIDNTKFETQIHELNNKIDLLQKRFDEDISCLQINNFKTKGKNDDSTNKFINKVDFCLNTIIDKIYNGNNSLISAAIGGHLELCKYFYKDGADIDEKDKYGFSALMWAAERGHEDVCKFLVEHGANVNIQSPNGETALLWAAERGRLDICKLLVNNGAKVNVCDKEGRTPLSEAKKSNNQSLVLYLSSFTR